MQNSNKLYINGEWVEPKGAETLSVINPANEKVICDITLASKADLDIAVLSAKTFYVFLFYEEKLN